MLCAGAIPMNKTQWSHPSKKLMFWLDDMDQIIVMNFTKGEIQDVEEELFWSATSSHIEDIYNKI